MTKTILVTGATGNQGHAVCRALLEDGHHVRGMTRDPRKATARELEQVGVEMVEGDFGEPASVRRAASDVDAAFLVCTPFEEGPEAEVEQGRNAIDALAAAGVPHIVYSSVASADRETGIPHFDSKARIERHLERSGAPFTIVAPVWFRDNLFAPSLAAGLFEGVLVLPLPPHRGLQNIGVPEIGRFVAMVMNDPERFRGERIDIASDETTPVQMAETLSRVTARTVEHVQPPLEEVRKDSPEAATLFSWFERVGYSVDTASLRRRFPEVGWVDFATWAEDQEWKATIEDAARAV